MTRTPLVAAALVLALLLPSALPAQTADNPRILSGQATVLEAETLSVPAAPSASIGFPPSPYTARPTAISPRTERPRSETTASGPRLP